MSDASVSIPALLKKTEHYDKDERYMATSDLCEVLKRQQQHSTEGGGGGNASSLDASTERQICTAVLRLLHDKSNDVQAVAVKTLSVLLITVHFEHVLEICDSLADQVLDAGKSELRDVYSIGMRTLVKTVPATVGDKVSQRLLGRLLEGISSSQDEEIALACFDVLIDLLQRFGSSAASVTRQHEPILQMCLTQLSSSPHAVARKRAGNTLACLSVVLSDALLMRMVESLLSQIDMAKGVGKEGRRKTRSAHSAAGTKAPSASNNVADTRALIRTMCAVSGQVGHRLGQQQIDRILPIFLRFTEPEDAVTGDDDEDDYDNMQDDNENDNEPPGSSDAAMALANELRESCFMGFESFVSRCPNEVEPHLEKIIQTSLAYMSFDPNYSYGTDEIDAEQQGDEEFDDEDDEYEQEDEDEEEDDDDDESWKVRRSAIRALKAVVQSKKHDPSSLWKTQYLVRRGKTMLVSEALVARFKEREENCRVGVIDCFNLLLTETIQAAQAGIVSFSLQDEMDVSSAGVSIDLRNEYSPKLVKAFEKVLAVKKGNERSKSSALALLATLCKAPGGVGGAAEIASVFQHIQKLLAVGSDTALHREGASKALRLDALYLVHAMLTSGNNEAVHVRVSLKKNLLPELCQAVKEQWYKVIAEALRALAAVPSYFVNGYTSDTNEATKKQEGQEVANVLYEAIEPLLAAHDVDQEIKECALLACGSLLSSLHATLDKSKETRLLQLLLERLRNETTRIAAIKTISNIAASSRDDSMDDHRIDLSPILSESISVMASFMKLQSRSLKQSALEALDTIVKNHGSHPALANGELFSLLLQELASLIVDVDLHLSYLSL
jgi:cullin-associated NEDD8-dissociated protein 1